MEIAFEHRELVKVKLQEGFVGDTKEVANFLAERWMQEFIQAMGRKFTLYRNPRRTKKLFYPGDGIPGDSGWRSDDSQRSGKTDDNRRNILLTINMTERLTAAGKTAGCVTVREKWKRSCPSCVPCP